MSQSTISEPLRVCSVFDPKCGRNDGAPLYTLEALKRRKDVKAFLYSPHGDSTLWGKYDLYWWVDFADDALGYQDFPMLKPAFYWSSDYHISPESYAHRLKRAGQADFIGCYQKRNVEEFIKDGIPEDKIFWLPPAFEPSCYRPGVWDKKNVQWVDAYPIKRYDICFVGHVNNQKREDQLDDLFREIPNFFYGRKIFEDCASIFNQSKIVFNTAHHDDINMRVFEALGTKSFLLTEYVPTLEEIFKPGVHLETYCNVDEMIDKAKYYLEHDDKRNAIAEQGYKEVIEKHTYDIRVNHVLNRIFNPIRCSG